MNRSYGKILSHAEQLQLVKAWKDTEDKFALDKLIHSNIRAVKKEAKSFYGKNADLSFDDLEQEGMLGLVKAASMFDDGKNVTFLSYAMWWVRAYMRKYVMDHKSVVRRGTTRNDRKLFSNISKVMNSLEQKYPEYRDRLKQASKTLKIPEAEIDNMINSLKTGDMRLDAPISSDDGENLFIDTISDSTDYEDRISSGQRVSFLSSAVKEIVDGLPDDEKQVIHNRFMVSEPKTLRDLASDMKISREWVRKIELRALDRIKKRLQSQYDYYDGVQ